MPTKQITRPTLAEADYSDSAEADYSGRAKALACVQRQAITTRDRDIGGLLPRVIARCQAKRITVDWNDALSASENHAAAALQLMDQLGWSERNDLVMGDTRDGFVFVQVPKSTR